MPKESELYIGPRIVARKTEDGSFLYVKETYRTSGDMLIFRERDSEVDIGWGTTDIIEKAYIFNHKSSACEVGNKLNTMMANLGQDIAKSSFDIYPLEIKIDFKMKEEGWNV